MTSGRADEGTTGHSVLVPDTDPTLYEDRLTEISARIRAGLLRPGDVIDSIGTVLMDYDPANDAITVGRWGCYLVTPLQAVKATEHGWRESARSFVRRRKQGPIEALRNGSTLAQWTAIEVRGFVEIERAPSEVPSPTMPIQCSGDLALRKRRGERVVVVRSIPWSLIEGAAQERQSQANHSQTLRKIAARGGFSACEALAVISGLDYDRVGKIDEEAAHRILYAMMCLLNRGSLALQEKPAAEVANAASDAL